jgi:hypothetical protein
MCVAILVSKTANISGAYGYVDNNSTPTRVFQSYGSHVRWLTRNSETPSRYQCQCVCHACRQRCSQAYSLRGMLNHESRLAQV